MAIKQKLDGAHLLLDEIETFGHVGARLVEIGGHECGTDQLEDTRAGVCSGIDARELVAHRLVLGLLRLEAFQGAHRLRREIPLS